jgi:hypothetical protein
VKHYVLKNMLGCYLGGASEGDIPGWVDKLDETARFDSVEDIEEVYENLLTSQRRPSDRLIAIENGVETPLPGKSYGVVVAVRLNVADGYIDEEQAEMDGELGQSVWFTKAFSHGAAEILGLDQYHNNLAIGNLEAVIIDATAVETVPEAA